MKKIDRLLLIGIVPPFMMTFCIALFVLIMQFLWKHIDDIMGKGISIWTIGELLFYASINLFPLALPIAVLISSVMVMGSLAEHYELSSLKSAGVSLPRVMLPLMVFFFGVALFSFFSANNFTPKANLIYKSRLLDMKRQRPVLSLDEGIFNYDFDNVIIRIGEKNSETGEIKDVLIYDHSPNAQNKMSRIIAESGRMSATEDGRYFIMQLFNGTQYQEAAKANRGTVDTYPFVRTSFKEYTKIFDLSAFELNTTDEAIYKGHYQMLSVSELGHALDSIRAKRDTDKGDLALYCKPYFYFTKNAKPDKTYLPLDSASITMTLKKTDEGQKLPPKSMNKVLQEDSLTTLQHKRNLAQKNLITIERRRSQGRGHVEQINSTQPVAPREEGLLQPPHPSSVVDFIPQKDLGNTYTSAASLARSIMNQADLAVAGQDSYKEAIMRHQYELHLKFSLAFACFLFLFIGAPMGAIVRKGGFGYPILIAIIFFVLFIMMMTMGKKMAEQFAISGVLGAWLPCLVVLPIGLFLTYKAMNDSKILEASALSRAFQRIISIFKRNANASTTK